MHHQFSHPEVETWTQRLFLKSHLEDVLELVVPLREVLEQAGVLLAFGIALLLGEGRGT